MELWSKGLGKVSLSLNLAEYDVHGESGKVILSGTVHNRMLWKARIVLFREPLL